MNRAEYVEQQLLAQLSELAGADGRLPTEQELCERYEASRSTIRSALAGLAARNLIVRRQGKGNFLRRAARIGTSLNVIVDYCEFIRCHGYQPGIEYLSSVIKYPSDEIAAGLRRPDDLAVERRTIFTANRTPVIYCINTIPLWVLPGGLAREIVRDPSISEPIFDFFDDRCHQRFEYRTTRIWPEIAQNIDAPGLSCSPTTPILVMDELTYNSQDEPIFHTLGYFPSRLITFEMLRHRDSNPVPACADASTDA
jgi:GntR family transcriptional regulator